MLTAVTTELMSAADGDVGNDFSNLSSISDNGQYVAFRSSASDLVAGDTNNRYDIFVRDVANETTTLVSTDSSGTQGNCDSLNPSISDDGRYVAFMSCANNLDAADTDTLYDIYVKDLQTGALTLASVTGGGVKSNGYSDLPSISGDGKYVAFHSSANNLDASDTDTSHDIYVKNLQTGTLTLASVATDGTKANSYSYEPSLSDDGQFLAFRSRGSNLDPADTDSYDDIFVRDLLNETTTLVSTSSSGANSNSWAYNPAISGNGQFVAFRSNANNLVSGDTNGRDDVFVKDLQTSATTRVSTDSAGNQANGGSIEPSISDDGRYVSFYSYADNLVGSDTNGTINDIFVKDRQTGVTSLVSVDSSGNQANDHSFENRAAISGDGQSVAFWSRATNLADGDSNNRDDVFRRDLLNGTTTLVSARDPDLPSPGNYYSRTGTDLAVSEDGRYVAFESFATNFYDDNNGNLADIAVRDRDGGSIVLANTSSTGVQANRASYAPSISDDGRYVAFASQANNLDANDSDTYYDIYVKDLDTGTLALASVNADGAKGNYDSQQPSISSDGRFVAFISNATNLDDSDTDTYYDVYVKDLQTGALTLVSVSTTGNKSNDYSYNPSISDDGQRIAFYSRATNLSPADSDNYLDVFVRDLVNDTTTLASTSSTGAKASFGAYHPTISGDGRYVAFNSTSTNLVSGDTNGYEDIFVKDLQTGATTRVSADSNGNQANSWSIEPSISDDGRYVAFRSRANNLVSGDTNNTEDIFVKNLQTGSTTRMSVSSSGNESNSFSFLPSISGNGIFVAYTSRATNLVGNATDNGFRYDQVYLSYLSNSPPELEDQSFDIAENSTAVGTVAASDPDDGDGLTYTITGGSDVTLFAIDDSTGELTFIASPDFENPSDADGDNVYEVEVTVTDDDGESAVGNMTITVLNEANVTGFVFADIDNDGEFDAEDAPLGNVDIALTEAGVDQLFGTTDDRTFTRMTDIDGFYAFEDVAAGLVRIVESGAPANLVDGVDTANGATDLDAVNDQFTIEMARSDANGMNFAEQADTGGLSSGDTATIGFWHNKNGQALIASLDQDGALSTWLLDNFGNIFDADDFAQHGGNVGEFYKAEFFKKKLKGTPKVDAQFMAVAFASFATSSNLSNSTAANFGFNVTDTGIGTRVINVGSSGAAFGVADGTDMTIMALLLATNSLTGAGADQVYDGAQDLDNDNVVDDTLGEQGTLDTFEKLLRELANDVYTSINEGGDIV